MGCKTRSKFISERKLAILAVIFHPNQDILDNLGMLYVGTLLISFGGAGQTGRCDTCST